jgi:hypothetical protein
MISTKRALVALALASVTFLAPLAPSAEAVQRRVRQTARPYNSVTLPPNQYFRLRMEDELSSKTSRLGNRFRATVVTPVYRNGAQIVPAGSIVGGRVTYAKRAGSRGREGALGVRFDSLTLPGGTRVPIVGSLIELQDGNSGNMSEDGVLEARSSKRRNIYFIGGGAAGGALLGAIIGGGKGAGIGTAVGAGAGIAGALLTKGKEAEVERGTEVGMALDRSARLPLPR